MNAKDLDDIRQLSLIFGFFIAVPGGWTWLKVNSAMHSLQKEADGHASSEDRQKELLRQLHVGSRNRKFCKVIFSIGLFLVTFNLVLAVCVSIFNNFVL